MSESILNALMQLFALTTGMNLQGSSMRSKGIVASFLERYLATTNTEEYLNLYDNYLDFYTRETESDILNGAVMNTASIEKICNRIIHELNQHERVVVFIRLLEFVHLDQSNSQEKQFLQIVATCFNLSHSEWNDLLSFASAEEFHPDNPSQILIMEDNPQDLSEELEGAWVERNRPVKSSDSAIKIRSNLLGKLQFLYLPQIQSIILKYDGDSPLTLDNRPILPKQLYVLDNGAIIRCEDLEPIYHSEIAAYFHQKGKIKILFEGHNIDYTFSGNKYGIHRFNFCEESGHLVGVIGGSGVGKSTLLNLLNGQLPLKRGTILINGYDLHKEKFKLQGIIGFVPQDDLLFEELTVYQNLYFNARLCFSNKSKAEIKTIVNTIISELDLAEVKDLKVGSPLNKFISGGQRKRLNIGLELMREPSILLVDEPTSGLSSMDAEKVINILKDLANKGRLIIANIHQPSSNIFRLFDHIWVFDKGGYPVYSGNPIDSIVYFKSHAFHANATESECPTCGNIDTEQILKIIEAKKIDPNGHYTNNRRRRPEEWYTLYQGQIESHIEWNETKKILPKHIFTIPGENEQYRIFNIRNLLTKLNNIQYLLIALLEAPILAAILAWFTKYYSDKGYLFSENKNLPQYLFMSVVVALFVGLTVSAEEIIRDRKIILRETFLNLSRFSYINSKITYLFILSALQTISFVVVGNLILDIKGMTWSYWLILFSTSCFANMLGLNLSSGLNSVIAIYITVPLMLVPQLLLSGVIVPFDDLHKSLTNKIYVPLIGDMMTSRWAYEALAVEQFKNNAFERNFYTVDQTISESGFKTTFLLPRLHTIVETVMRNQSDSSQIQLNSQRLKMLRNEIRQLQKMPGVYPFDYFDKLNVKDFNEKIGEETNDYITYLTLQFYDRSNKANASKDSIYKALQSKWGDNSVYRLKETCANNRLADVVMNRNEINKYIEVNNRIISKKDPVFTLPESNYGRAQFYAPFKKLNGKYVDTLWFNVSIIWLMIFILYITLLTDTLRNALDCAGRFQIRRYRKAASPKM